MYFQGGGSCWNQATTLSSGVEGSKVYCFTDAEPWPVYGVFDRSDHRNSYAAYTIINILYCSGDNHVGNAVRNYTDNSGGAVIQKGAANVEAVLDWIESQQTNGYLSEQLQDLVIMGCSAGSLASQVWGNEIIRRLKYPTRSAIILDRC